MKFRNLSSEEIEVRVQSVAKNDKGVILLLYKDARVDQNILDETVTPKYWQKEYYEANGVLFCKVGINVGALTGNYDSWVWKSDCGSESNIEAQKGEASDKDYKFGFGRSNIWFAKDYENNPKLKSFLERIIETTDNYNGENDLWKGLR